MISRVEEAAKRSSAETEIIIVDSIDQLQTYNSWLLPSLVVNGQMVARGYIPEINKIQRFFT
jgi:hypothetical protein